MWLMIFLTYLIGFGMGVFFTEQYFERKEEREKINAVKLGNVSKGAFRRRKGDKEEDEYAHSFSPI